MNPSAIDVTTEVSSAAVSADLRPTTAAPIKSRRPDSSSARLWRIVMSPDRTATPAAPNAMSFTNPIAPIEVGS